MQEKKKIFLVDDQRIANMITKKMIETNTKLGEEIEDEEKPIRLEEEPEDGEEEIEDEEDQPKLDPHMRETLHILHDYIKLLNPKKQIAAKDIGTTLVK